MARRAIKDTFVFEDVGGARVRRRIREGQMVPPAYEADDADVEEIPDDEDTGFGAIVSPPPPKRRRVRKPRAEPDQNPDPPGSGRLPADAEQDE